MASSFLKLYYYQYETDFVLSPQHKGHPIPLLLEPPVDIVAVEEPGSADFLVFPYDITPFQCYAGFDNTLKFLKTLPLLGSKPERSVYYAHHDDCRPFSEPFTLFKASVSRNLPDRHIIPVPFPVEDFSDCLTFQPEEIHYMTSFVGYPGSSQLRSKLLCSVAAEKRLRMQLHITPQFHGHLSPEEMLENRERYVVSLRSSLTVLCPRGTGLNSVRFYETLAMGRIPILIGDECSLPAEDIIPYHYVMLRIPERMVDQAGEMIFDWLASKTPEQLIQRCVLARKIWETYFSISGTAKFMAKELYKIHRALESEQQ